MNTRCPSCGHHTLAYTGDPLAERGVWRCPCGWNLTGRPPRDPAAPPYVPNPKAKKIVRREKPVPTFSLAKANEEAKKIRESKPAPVYVPKHRPRAPELVATVLLEKHRKGGPGGDWPQSTSGYCPIPGQFKSVPFRPIDGVRNVPLARIVTRVCERCRIEPRELVMRCRHKRIVLARRLIVAMSRGLTTASFPEIAQVMTPANPYTFRANHSSAVTVFGKFIEWKDQPVVDLLALDDPERKAFGGLTMDDLYWEIRNGITGEGQPRSVQGREVGVGVGVGEGYGVLG